MTEAPLALFRCDASPSIGAGHVTRCLALAEALASAGWRIVFVVGPETTATVPALAASGFEVQVLGAAAAAIDVLGEAAAGQAALLVVDHYGCDRDFEQACRSFARTILAFDDATGRDHDCDILVDAAAAGPALYREHVPGHARILAGPAYALVRSAFVARRAEALARRDGRAVSEILVSCGATDPANATAAALDALDGIADEIDVTVVLSSQAPHLDSVRQRLRGKARLLLDVDDMAALMTRADLAIGAPGATSYERAVLGLPSILVTLADNQRGIARMITEAGAAIDAGELDEGFKSRLAGLVAALCQNAAARQQVAQAAGALVDGRGSRRVMLGTLGHSVAKDGAAVRLRLATASDESWILKLQQHPTTRSHFRETAAPTPAEHHHWMQQILADAKRWLLVVEVGGQKTGIVRLDRLSNFDGKVRYEVSIAIDPACRGRGIGSAALQQVRRLVPGAVLDAAILPANQASTALFKAAGYVEVFGNARHDKPSPALS